MGPPHGKERHRLLVSHGNLLQQRQTDRAAGIHLHSSHFMAGDLSHVSGVDGESVHDAILLAGCVDRAEDAWEFCLGGVVGHRGGGVLCHFMGASTLVELVGYAGIVLAECSDAGVARKGGIMGIHDAR